MLLHVARRHSNSITLHLMQTVWRTLAVCSSCQEQGIDASAVGQQQTTVAVKATAKVTATAQQSVLQWQPLATHTVGFLLSAVRQQRNGVGLALIGSYRNTSAAVTDSTATADEDRNAAPSGSSSTEVAHTVITVTLNFSPAGSGRSVPATALFTAAPARAALPRVAPAVAALCLSSAAFGLTAPSISAPAAPGPSELPVASG